MKKDITSLALLIAVTTLAFSCKKASTSTPTTTTPATTTTGPVTTNATSSFSVNGVSQGSNLTQVKGTSSNNNSYQFLLVGSPWGIQIIFSGANSPGNGTYTIQDSTDNQIPAGKCSFIASGPNSQFGRAKTGSITVSTGTSNTITFNNIQALQTNLNGSVTATYPISGVIKY